ncbi:Amino acid transporter [Entamoeba marina]
MSPLPLGESGVFGTIFNIANTIIGNGTLAMPFAMLYSGWGGGLVLLVIAWILSNITIYLLTRCCEITNKATYKEVSEVIGGPRLSIIVQTVAMFYTTGTCIGYIIFLGGFLPHLVGQGSFYSDRTLLLVFICFLLIYPLSFSKTLDALKYFSVGAVVCVTYTAIVITIESFTTYTALDVHSFKTNWTSLRGFPIMTGAFCCHYNVFRFYVELKNRSSIKLAIIAVVASSIALLAYSIVGVFGYKSIGNDVVGNILVAYPRSDIPIMIACGSFCFIMAASFPLVHHAQRGLLDVMLFEHWKDHPVRRICESLILVSFVILVAVAVKDIEIVLAYNGAAFGALIVYIFPAYFLYKLSSGWEKIISLIIAIIGVFIGLLGLTLTTLDICGVFK